MIEFLLTIVPIFVIVVLGHALRYKVLPSNEFWNFSDKLVYWVLVPALLFNKTSTIDISLSLLGSYATVILGAFACAGVFGLLSAAAFRMPGSVAGSVLQGCARHNTYISLAIAERVYGADGLSLAALATAILVPVTNMTMVPILVSMQRKADGSSLVRSILRDLARNPLIISVAIGFAVNFSGTGEIPIVHETARILGGAALPVVLLCVGANLHPQSMATSGIPVIVAIVGKMIVFPIAIVFLAQAFGLSELETFVAVLFGAAPAAPSSYALARQLGGDAPLMAAILTIQTAIAIVTLPITVQLAAMIIS